MKNRTQTANDDIVQQRYKGANPVVAALGEGAVHTKVLALTGLAVGALGAAIFHKQANPLIKQFNEWVGKLSASENVYVKPVGDAIDWLLAFGRGPVKFAKEREVVKSLFKNSSPETISRWKDAIEGGIIVSTAAGIAGGITGGGAGYQDARAGKKQFEAAKSEISTLRTKLIETQSELEDAKTVRDAHKGKLKVSGDDQPAIERPDTTISHAHHQGMAHHAHTQEAQLF